MLRLQFCGGEIVITQKLAGVDDVGLIDGCQYERGDDTPPTGLFMHGYTQITRSKV